jgi:hypothetical protein
MSVVLFVLGEPGIGKTSLARRLLQPDSYLVAKPKWTVGETVCAAGHYTGDTFDGADTVPYNGVADALRYWDAHLRSHALTMLDGDRFSHEGALAHFRPAALIRGVYLSAPAEIAVARRAARGSNQNATWLKGRQTKAANFAMRMHDAGYPVLRLDARASTLELEIEVRRMLAAALRPPA